MTASLPFRMTAGLRSQLTKTVPKWTAKYQQPGEPRLFLITDPEIPCKWLVLYGWKSRLESSDYDTMQGDVVYRGPVKPEHGPQFDYIPDNVYVLRYFQNRTVTEL